MKIDWWLVLPVSLLVILSLILLRSVVPQLWTNQAMFVFISLFAFLIFANLDYRFLTTFYIPLYVLCIVFLLSPFVLGSHSRGALRWLQFGQIFIQPSELIKPFLLLIFSYVAVLQNRFKWFFLLTLFLLPISLIFIQPDLGTSLVLASGWFVIFLKVFPYRIYLLLLLLLLPFSWLILRPFQKDRILTFINPYRDPLGRGYHVIQSTIAVGSGQLFGRGLGQGTQSQLRFLPERHTDFIFASLAEELGFFGSLLVLGLLGTLVVRIYHISQETADESAKLFSAAILGMLGFQTFVNIGMNIGLAPVTGITLPFLSYGGSSLLSLCISLGILSSISVRSHTISSFQIR